MFPIVLAQWVTFLLILAMTAFIFRRKRPNNFPPGPQALPIIGNLHQLGMEPYKAFMKLAETYGDVFAVDLASYSGIVLNDFESIKEAFSSDSFSGRPALRPTMERMAGVQRGIIFSSGKQWVEQRRYTLKTLREFGFGKRSMENLIQQEISELIESFQLDAGKPIDLSHSFTGPVFNSLWNLVAGERFTKDDPKFKQAVHCLSEALAELKTAGLFYFFPTLSKLFPEWTGYNKYMQIMNSANTIVRTTIEGHKQTFQEGEPRDLLDAYLSEISKTNDPDSSFYGAEGFHNLTIGLADLFLAGTETTSTTLTWVFFILAQKIAEQEKLFLEIEKVVGVSRLPSLADRDSMPYTEALIMEVMRISSILPVGVFRATTENVNFHGYSIPKGTLVISNLYGTMKNSKTWGDPEEFRPERFIFPDGKLNRHHESFLAFSYGKRGCLGESLARDELFLFVTTIFQKFRVTGDPSQKLPGIDEYNIGLTLTPKPHRVVMEERSLA